ncbi:MAG: MarR family transcriptional regulator [Pseudomonadota bacterium]
MNKQEHAGQIFALFNEIGIISQLSRTLFESRLPHGFLLQHFSVLNHLIRVKNGQTPLVLAQAFQVPKNSMTHTLSGLEKAGLVELKPNPKDGRSKQVWLTEAGHSFRDQAIGKLMPDLLELAQDFEGFDFTGLVTQLAEVRAYLDAARD